MTISFTVNGVAHHVDDSQGGEKLLDFLHGKPNLTGTKFCCGMGVCRACTVAVRKPPSTSAEPVVSCSTPLALMQGCEITTVEGVAKGTDLHPIQEKFLENFAFQCGYCTPGFVMASTIFLDWLETAPIREGQLDAAITEAIGAHICRCTGYVRYHEAVRAAAMDVLRRRGIVQ